MLANLKKLLLIATFAILAVGIAAPAHAADDGKDKTEGKDAPKKKGNGTLPFAGKIGSIDKTAMTLTVKGKEKDRVFTITSQTRIMKAGKPATLDEATPDERVTGSYKKGEGDKLDAVSIYIGGQPEKKKKDDKGDEKK